jgi:hypothetical protein
MNMNMNIRESFLRLNYIDLIKITYERSLNRYGDNDRSLTRYGDNDRSLTRYGDNDETGF